MPLRNVAPIILEWEQEHAQLEQNCEEYAMCRAADVTMGIDEQGNDARVHQHTRALDQAPKYV